MMRVAVRNDEGKATALRGDDFGNIRVSVAESNIQRVNQRIHSINFEGKEPNNLTVPHIAKRGSFELGFEENRVIHPTPTSQGWSEFQQWHYDYISKIDEFATGETTTDIGKYACQLFVFNICEYLKTNGIVPSSWGIENIRNNVKRFDVVWRGRGEGGGVDGCSLHFWRYLTNRYDSAVKTHDSDRIEELIFRSEELNQNLINVIDRDGFIYLMARASHPASESGQSRIVTEYIEIRNVEFTGEYLMTDTARAWDENSNSLRVIAGSNVKDDEGREVLRVVDAAPFAYDLEQDRLKVSVEDTVLKTVSELIAQRSRKYTEVETLFSGTLGPGEGFAPGEIMCRYKGEDETRLLINTNKQPWRLILGAGPFVSYSNPGTTFPNTDNMTTAYPSEHRPFHVLPIYCNTETFIPENATWQDAYPHRQLNDFQVRFTNQHESETAEVTIKVMRIYRGL